MLLAPNMGFSRTRTRLSKDSADHFKTAFRRPGADLPPEGVHCEGAELLVTTRRHRWRMARATGGTLRTCRGSFCRGLRETQPGPASTDRRAACAATSVL